MYVASVELNEFRAFRNARIDLEHPEGGNGTADDALPNVTLLLGNNGAGKTSLLKALALSVLAPVIQSSGYKPYYLIRVGEPGKVKLAKSYVQCQLVLHGQDVGEGFEELTSTTALKVKFQGRGSYETILPDTQAPGVDLMFEDSSPAFFMAGYGATRRVESVEHLDTQSAKKRGLRYLRVAGLFEEYITLWPLSPWLDKLRTAAKARFKEIVGLFARLLPADTSFTGEFKDLEPVFLHRGLELPFGALSDGYRGYIGLLADLLYHLHLSCPRKKKLTDMAGVVLVDDIDLHLHPSWQRTVVPDVARAFPRLQFVLITHSPLVAGTLHSRNVRVVEDQEVKQLTERVHGLSADQLLTSSYFNLPTPRSPDAEKKLARMAQKVADRGNIQDAIAVLNELAGKTQAAAE